MIAPLSNSRRDFYSKQLAQKFQELNTVQSQLEGALGNLDELKLNQQAETILEKIEELEAKLKELDSKDINPNVRHLNLEKSFQKIDFSQAKKIAKSINDKLASTSGAILIFLQRSTKQKGCYCINEFLDLIVSDRKVGDEIIGDFRTYPIDLGSPISEFNEVEFSKRLASYLSNDAEESLDRIIKKLCLSLRGGSIVFIRIENWDSAIEKTRFLNWFIERFWQTVIDELEDVFREYSQIRFIVAVVAKSKAVPDCRSLDYFCKKNSFDPRKFIELPLPDWSVEDIKNWLINFRGLSNTESLRLAKQIHHESEGTPDTICSILEREFKI